MDDFMKIVLSNFVKLTLGDGLWWKFFCCFRCWILHKTMNTDICFMVKI